MIEQVVIDGTPVPGSGNIDVPAGQNKLEFRYTGLSLSAPARCDSGISWKGLTRIGSAPDHGAPPITLTSLPVDTAFG